MAHYHVINKDTGGTLNVIKRADDERDRDDPATRNKKRKAQAQVMLQRWQDNYYRSADLRLKEVPSDD